MKRKEITKWMIDLIINEVKDNYGFKYDIDQFEYHIEYEKDGELRYISFKNKNDDIGQTAYSYIQFMEKITRK